MHSVLLFLHMLYAHITPVRQLTSRTSPPLSQFSFHHVVTRVQFSHRYWSVGTAIILYNLNNISLLLVKNVHRIILHTHHIYRVIQEERSIFWEVIVSVIVRKKVDMNMCVILNGYRDRAV